MRERSFAQAINEALKQILDTDDRAFLIGQGVTSPWYVGSTTVGLVDRFGSARIIDTPVSENCITGAAVGAALAGMHPILVHPRMDFMYYAMDQIANHAANWHYMFGGKLNVPLTIWGIINRGGEQAAQHSQALQAMYAHIPGLKVVMPATPYDAKGLMIASVRDGNPVLYIDERWLYDRKGDVPEEMYTVPIGKGIIRRKGKDITVVATSYLVGEAVKAAELLNKDGWSAEVVDLRTVKPLDGELILGSVNKTGRLVVADGGWKSFGIGGEIIARVTESNVFKRLKAPAVRVALPDIPAPASGPLEKAYYPDADSIVTAIKNLMGDRSGV
jgi:pyruvate/2-oxoglutarate/acetoin dehydrogenase E1 component